MLAFAQLRIDALFAVLLGTTCVMMSLRAWQAVSKRAVVSRDAAAIRAVEEAARGLQGEECERDPNPR
jgi:hypothetical protein